MDRTLTGEKCAGSSGQNRHREAAHATLNRNAGTIVATQWHLLRVTLPPARIGSGAIISTGLLAAFAFLLCCDQFVGWDATWRSVGVTPLSPHFFDTHVVIDYAACAAQGVDPYVPQACNPANFNIPPIWLWIGKIGLYQSFPAPLLASLQIAAAIAVIIVLLKGRSATDGVIALVALLSPSVLMGIERANSDLLILALVGSAALAYNDEKGYRPYGALALAYVATILKLYPFFTVAVGCRLTRKSLFFAIALGVLSQIYFITIFHDLLLIRRNVPTTFMLSYGYKAIFLGIDHLRVEAGLSPIALADTWFPALTAASAVLLALVIAMTQFKTTTTRFSVGDSRAGTAFYFGSGIYCGTFLLGTNFIYRLIFLLLCLPQFQDWGSQTAEQNSWLGRIFVTILLAILWLNGDSNGHTTFHFAPQLLDWLMFVVLACILFLNFFRKVRTSYLQKLVAT